jgi:hypothetical protein
MIGHVVNFRVMLRKRTLSRPPIDATYSTVAAAAEGGGCLKGSDLNEEET